MRVYVYANCWNEINMLPYFMRHYDPFVDRFVILDDGSTDGSVEFLEGQAKVRLIKAHRSDISYIEQARIFFNEAWKQDRSRADWIITCNVDEHIYHSDMRAYLQGCLQIGVTVIPANGYEMVALRFPSRRERLCDQVRLGAQAHRLTGPSGMLNKIMVFNPQAIEDVHFNHGRHTTRLTGRVVYPYSVELKLLHYKFLGLDYVERRYAELKTGLLPAEIKHGVAVQYLWNRGKIYRNYKSILSHAQVVIPSGLIPDVALILSFLPLRIKLRLLEMIARHYRHPIIRLLLPGFKAIKWLIFYIWPKG